MTQHTEVDMFKVTLKDATGTVIKQSRSYPQQLAYQVADAWREIDEQYTVTVEAV